MGPRHSWPGAGAAFAVNVLLLGGAILSFQDAQRSVNEGVYSVAQAARGQKAFETSCTICHDTGRFTGSEFIAQWSGRPLHALFDVMKTTMPEDNPGGLQAQQYADIVSFILRLNKFPPGDSDLLATDESLRAVTMEAPKGPGGPTR